MPFKKGHKINLGKTHSEESKKRMSQAQLGKTHSEKTKRKLSVAHKGQIPWNTGKTRSEETKEKISKSLIGKLAGSKNPMYGKRLTGSKNHMYGKTHSEESKKMMSQAKQGEKNVLYGKHRSEETRKKISVSNIGKELSEETKEKIRDAQFLRNDGPWRDTWGEKELQSILTTNEIQFVGQKYFRLARHRVDIFIEPNICIEVDGDYFHGNPHPYPHRSSIHPGHKPDEILRGGKTAEEKWERDRRQTEALEQQGNVVLRFWQSELEQNPEKCLQKIIKIIKEAKSVLE